ncbi:peptidase domain-containing ABC transporter [Asticcacaulis sp. SL142]|uniref:peptidase domain-containing ABC transporter n=1 Tax=Asticcacaulis sp. SL142 TaxID=2995155 RepID=UPI00226CE280|nr:peptidase domain-containing ABC transporter [Asticcacaulis sp. SL142]WAC49753.1 peptidase domain-containing ABC transporter [Asticcacaulis sp. SL142]
MVQYLQSEHSECGLVCIAYSAAKMGAHHDLAELRRRFPTSSRGLDLQQMTDIAAALDMMSRAVRCEIEELDQLRLPAILHWNLKHFVVLDRVTATHIFYHDPALGRVKMTRTEAGRRFTGIALELSEAPAFKPRKPQPSISIWSWMRYTPQLFAGLGQTLILSLMLQAYVIASPFYMQLAIDQAALKGDAELLKVLAVGFGLFGLFNMGAALLRNFAMQHLSAYLSWDMSLRLFRHLVRLPLDWFQKRKLADTISRFDAINPIRDLISGSLMSSAIDGVLAITTLLMMFLFEWKLGLLVVGGTVCYVIVRLVTLPRSLRLSAESLGAMIAENGKRIETIKAIQTVKTMAAETQQETQWSNQYSTLIKRNLESARFKFSVDAVHQGLDVLVTTSVIYLGIMAIIAGNLTVGILYAFMAYKGQFTGAVTKVVEQFIQWKLSDIYSMRLADIVLNPKEEGIDRVETALPELQGQIYLENLSFRYAPHEPIVFKNINLKIEAGDFLAIVGPSGAGKSSLMKVMSGLYNPTGGEVKVDGRPIRAWGAKLLRRSYGVVMQDDELLSGSIAENVAFFDDHIDMDRVWTSLEMAALKEEVLALPMKADSHVGDMGGSLSGGQKQRLLIARALYKKPKVLFFDEATSHLDVKNESIINQSLKVMNITRIVIAHRRETIEAADKVFDIKKGRLVRQFAKSAKVSNPYPDLSGSQAINQILNPQNSGSGGRIPDE